MKAHIYLKLIIMFLISFVLSVGLTAIFANPFFPNINGGNPKLFSQQEPSTTQGDQVYSPGMPQLSMETNHQMYPMPQQTMMQPPMMQGFQSPFLFNPISQQQLSMLLMASYARAMALTQLLNMQNRYQLYQPNQYSDPAVNNYSLIPAPLPYAQQPQVDLQNYLQNEMLQQQQQQQAESQQKVESQNQDILEKRKIQREFDMEIERHERLMKRKKEENDLEKQQQEVERILRDEEEMKRQQEETRKQILKEEQKEMEQKEKDLKLRQKEELRFKKIEEEKLNKNQEKLKQNQENMKPKKRAIRQQRKQKNSNKNVIEDVILSQSTMKKIKTN